jgi:hypothetical protein
MKNLFVLLILSSAFSAFSQNIKHKDLRTMHTQAPTEKEQIKRSYMWMVKEIATGQNDTAFYFSGSHSYHVRQNYYASTGNMGNFGGFKDFRYQTTTRDMIEDYSYIEAFFGPTEVIEKKAYSKGSAKKADGTPGSAWHLSLQVDIKKYLKMYYIHLTPDGKKHEVSSLNLGEDKVYRVLKKECDILINDEDMAGENVKSYVYPDSFDKSKKFTSEAAVKAGFNKEWPAIEKSIRSKIINFYILKSRRIIQSKYSFARDAIGLECFPVKDKDGAYPEFEKWSESFQAVAKDMKQQDKDTTRMNWYSDASKAIIKATLESIEEFISTKTDAPVSIIVAARMNRMWMYFLNSDFDKAIAENKALTQLQLDLEEELATAKKDKVKIDKTKKKSMEAAIDGIKYNHFDELLILYTEYPARYENNAATLGWK